ncbi:MAG: transcription-repair coupling factor [Kiritimatiellae bacterium]|nr:transcription-repair coupling factor [Kiritimatiellia bacterium]
MPRARPAAPRARDLLRADLAAALRAPLEGVRLAAAPEPPGAAAAALAAALRRDPDRGVVLAVLPGPVRLEAFSADAAAFLPAGDALRVFPMLSPAGEDPEAAAARLSVFRLLRPERRGARPPPMLLATCVQALLQPSPDPAAVDAASLRFEPGAAAGRDETAAWLEANGYRREPEVFEPGTYAVKGGVLDVWPAAARVPSRVEFFGDEVDSLRTFDPATQRSDQKLASLRVPPRRTPPGARLWLADALPPDATALWIGGAELDAAADAFARENAAPGERRLPALRAALLSRPAAAHVFLGLPQPEDATPVSLPVEPAGGLADAGGALDPAASEAARHALYRDVLPRRGRRRAADVHVCLDTGGTLERVREELGADAPADLRVARLSGGFRMPGAVFLAQADLFGRAKRPGSLCTSFVVPGGAGADAAAASLEEALDRVASGADAPSEALASRIVDHVEPGDVVVHAERGIGRYLGLKQVDTANGRAEMLALEYAGGTRLYVPLSQAHLVSRYTGVGDAPVKLHSLSGRRWSVEKAQAGEAVRRLAVGMLRRQARRRTLPGHAFAAETPWYEEFEASFPYEETPGQADCIRSVLADMRSPHPMDRLVCGDAGYGKTEIALRAAFVAAMQGKQVAVLVPTTVLAQQHFETFRERFAPYPLRVALHSRFATQGERRAALRGAADGTVDVLVGTHGILEDGVRFKDLGLVVIDEEQRFGVRDKEKLKSMSEMVDVLTLSATPIPRTLYLGLVGARDLSLLRTPPPGRVATETHVVADSDDVVRDAVLAEISRGGQVFFLHNRVMTIHLVRRRLERLFPHLRIAVGHGRLPPRETERIVRDFAAGLYDVLLSTTIVENGIDVPRANTILVDRADRFGVADLYQLRGRVGRGSVKAHAYFLVPRDAPVTADAKERLEALAAASRLGSGVSLAMRDLSLRGAGNLLGAEQSGHIAAVGFRLYCQLLRRAVAQLKGEAPPLLVNVETDLPFLAAGPGADDRASGAFLPYAYVEDDAGRIELHRRLAECSSEAELDALRAETRDRFGPVPAPLDRLFRVARCRILAAERGVTRISMREGALFLYRDGLPLRFRGAVPRPSGETPDELLASVERLLRLHPATAASAPLPAAAPPPEIPSA